MIANFGWGDKRGESLVFIEVRYKFRSSVAHNRLCAGVCIISELEERELSDKYFIFSKQKGHPLW
jgi:hypothetical protein